MGGGGGGGFAVEAIAAASAGVVESSKALQESVPSDSLPASLDVPAATVCEYSFSAYWYIGCCCRNNSGVLAVGDKRFLPLRFVVLFRRPSNFTICSRMSYVLVLLNLMR